MASADKGGTALSAVLFEQNGRVVTLTLNRPDTRNALSSDLVEGLIDRLERANADRGVSCVVIAGAGKDFSSGGNLHELRELTSGRNLAAGELAAWYRDGIQRIPKTFRHIDVVTVAAVHGHAIGAGCDLASMCDLRIVADTASFAESFARVGLISGDGGAWFLPRVVGMARAREMMLTCEPVDARTAERWGLASRVVSEADLLDAAQTAARRIAALPPNALRATKELLRETEHLDLDQVLDISARLQARLQLQPDHLEAVAAVLERRTGCFTGLSSRDEDGA